MDWRSHVSLSHPACAATRRTAAFAPTLPLSKPVSDRRSRDHAGCEGCYCRCLLTAPPLACTGCLTAAPQAWTSWDLCRFDVNATVIKEVAEALESSGLKDLGWNTLQVDEGWEACAEYNGHYSFETTCKTQTPRDAQGRIVANATKFPGGMKPLADWLHAKGFKLGIYTSASHSACGGNWGSRGHETTDAKAFAEWGIDWVKVRVCSKATSVIFAMLLSAVL